MGVYDVRAELVRKERKVWGIGDVAAEYGVLLHGNNFISYKI